MHILICLIFSSLYNRVQRPSSCFFNLINNFPSSLVSVCGWIDGEVVVEGVVYLILDNSACEQDLFSCSWKVVRLTSTGLPSKKEFEPTLEFEDSQSQIKVREGSKLPY